MNMANSSSTDEVTNDSIFLEILLGVTFRLLKADTVTWFWIGTHDEYDRLIK